MLIKLLSSLEMQLVTNFEKIVLATNCIDESLKSSTYNMKI